MKLPVIDVIVFLFFTLGVVLFGLTFYRNSRSTGSYTSAGGSLPGWVVALSIFATYVSSISFLALPGKAYQSNWNVYVFSLSIPFAAFLAARYFIPHYRNNKSISAYSYLEKRFGLWARLYASSCYLLTQLMRTGAILLLLALPLNTLFGWDTKTIIIVTGITVTLYAMAGGIRAVMWTDAIQAVLLISGAVASAVILTFNMPEGPQQLFDVARANGKFSLGSFGPGLGESTFWVVLIYGIFINMQNYGIDQNYVQRYLTAKSMRSAIQSTLLGSLLYIPVSLLFVYIGTALFSYYTVQPDLLPEGLKGAENADKVFPWFIVNGLPAGVTGLLIASIFAAGMSTVSTSLNSSATILLTDFFVRLKWVGTSEKAGMKILYLSTMGVGLGGTIIALSLVHVTSILDAWWALASIFSGGMLGLFLLGFISKRATHHAASMAVFAGVAVIAWMSLSPLIFNSATLKPFKSPLHTNLSIVMGTTVIFLTGFLISSGWKGLIKKISGK